MENASRKEKENSYNKIMLYHGAMYLCVNVKCNGKLLYGRNSAEAHVKAMHKNDGNEKRSVEILKQFTKNIIKIKKSKPLSPST